MMKKLCLLLAALMLFTLAIPAFAEDDGAEFVKMLEGDWVHEDSAEHYLLFDGVDKFYYSTEDSFYYGYYTYIEDSSVLLVDDMDEGRIVSVDDDLVLTIQGVEGSFTCQYRYSLMNYPNTDEGAWLNEDGVTTLLFDLEGEFEFENDDEYLYGEYEYLGGGDYQLLDDEGNTHIVSIYEDNSISMEGIEGYFWLQDELTGDDPFEDFDDAGEYAEEDTTETSELPSGDSIELSGAWYKNGDPSTIPFVLDGDSYSCEDSVMGYEVTGTWTLSEIAEVLTEEETESVPYISMESDDGMPGGWDPVPMAGNRLLYSYNKDAYFLHESMIGTEEGDRLCKMAEFMRADWLHAEDGVSIYLEFSCMGNAVICTQVDENGENLQAIMGSWALQGDSIDVVYIDDSTGSYALTADTIVVDDVEFVK